MDFQNTPEQEAFRQELRGWLAANLPRELCVDDPTDERVAPDRPTFEKRVAWQRTMCKAGWVGVSWPKEYGGRGATLMEQLIYDEECFRVRAWRMVQLTPSRSPGPARRASTFSAMTGR